VALIPVREVRRECVGIVGQTHQFQYLHGPGPDGLLLAARAAAAEEKAEQIELGVQMRTHDHVVQHRGGGEEDVSLEDPRYPLLGYLVGGEAGDVLTPELYGAGGGLEGAADHVEDGALAGAVGTDDADDLSLVHVEAEVADGGQPPEYLRQSTDLK